MGRGIVHKRNVRGDYPIKICRVMYVRWGNCPQWKRPKGKCTLGQNSYITLIDKSLPIFRPRKFKQRTSDSLSLIVRRYLIFARISTQKHFGGESPRMRMRMQTHLGVGE